MLTPRIWSTSSRVCLSTCTAFFIFYTLRFSAQISTDGTVGTAMELTGQSVTIEQTLGKRAGNNLFHSFSEFNIKANESATFTGDADIQRVISRVTGGQVSNIDGLLESQIPDADFYFVNPAGVMFGPNASIKIDGSFHVSTADYLKFGENNKFFSEPLENEVLSTEAPTAYGFLGADIGTLTFNNFRNLDTEFKTGETLSIIGGDIEAVGSRINAPEGNIALISLGSEGELQINCDESNSLTFNTDDFTDFGEISLSQGTQVIADGEGGGQILIQGKNVELNSFTLIQAQTLGAKNGRALEIIASENLRILDNSEFFTHTTGSGNGGNITIKTKNMRIVEGFLYTFTNGEGDGGDIFIDAESILMDGNQKISLFPLIFAQTDGNGDAGNIRIDTGDLEVIRGAFIDATTAGSGRGGNLMIEARSILLQGDGIATGIRARTQNKIHRAPAGTVTIYTDTLEIFQEALISVATSGAGDAGRIEIHADSIRFDGNGDGIFTGISAQSLNKNAENLAGNAGKVTIDTDSLEVVRGAVISGTTESKGNGGSIEVQADSIRLDGEGLRNSNGNQLFTGIDVQTFNETNGGHAGDITISTKSLEVSEGAVILARTGGAGAGEGGSIDVNAETIRFDGRGQALFTGIGAHASATSKNHAGDIQIRTNSLEMLNVATISASTLGEGDGGTVEIRAESIRIDGKNNELFTGLGAQSPRDIEDGGRSGDISVKTVTLGIFNNGRISTASLGSGSSGNIKLEADSLTLNNNAVIETKGTRSVDAGVIDVTVTNVTQITDSAISSVAEQDGGDISISSRILRLTDAGITATAGNDGGNIAMDTDAIVLDGGEILARAELGNGGDITIVTQGIFENHDQENLIDASSEKGISGTIEVIAPDINLTAGLLPLTEEFLQADSMTLSKCSTQYAQERIGSLTVLPYPGDSLTIEDLLPSSSFIDNTESPNSEYLGE